MRNEKERLLVIEEAINTDITLTVIERDLPMSGWYPSK